MHIKPEIALAIDIGGSKYMVGLVDHNGHILYSLKGSWQQLTAKAVLGTVLAASKKVLRACPGVQPAFAGITIPGLANPLAGLWVKASFSGIENLPIVTILQQELGLACYADNDGQACTLAEKMFGGGQGCKSFLYITVSN
ncbi:MAG: ROK family protein, partial [Oscillospiraceae bacterium]